MKLATELLVAYEYEHQQVQYLQAEIAKIAAAVPGLIKINYGDHSGATTHALAAFATEGQAH